MQKGGLTADKMKASARAMANKMKSKTHSFATKTGFKEPKLKLR